MSRKNIIIAGAGFAGVSALARFRRHKSSIGEDFNIILVDKKSEFEFLPMLPDVVGGWMTPELLKVDLSLLAEKYNVDFVNNEIKGVDPENKVIQIGGQNIDYEYLLIATGSETNFYGDHELERTCFKLDNVSDAVSIKENLLKGTESGRIVNVVIAGGGYTGVEIATNIDFLLRKEKRKAKIYILEASDDILKMVPGWIRKNVKDELKALNIEIISKEALVEYKGDVACLKSGRMIGKSICIWSAGVQTAQFLQDSDFNKEKTRVLVGTDLSPKDKPYKDVLIAGDSSFFITNRDKQPLRMAVMFSMGQGKIAADNIALHIRNRAFKTYKPIDLGYLVPMSHGKAYGTVMGFNVKGVLGYLMHYLMCVYRSWWGNKSKMIRDIIQKGRQTI